MLRAIVVERRVGDQPAEHLLRQAEHPRLVLGDLLADLLAELALGDVILPLELRDRDVDAADRGDGVGAEAVEDIR